MFEAITGIEQREVAKKKSSSPEPERQTTEIEEVMLVITKRMTKLEGKSRLSEKLFPLLSGLDFSQVDSRLAIETIRTICSKISIDDQTDQVVDPSSSISTNLLWTIPTPHMLINLKEGERILIVPKDIDLICIYHPVESKKGAWVCGNIISI